MKYLILVLSATVLFTCQRYKNQQNNVEEVSDVENTQLNWLLGSWARVGEKEGKQTYEYWKKNKDGQFIGLGCTLKGKDTIWKEDVLLAEDANGWKFEVVGLGDTESTIFRVTQMEENRFVCENKENEFPKKIEYAFDGKNINAVISGGGPVIPFNFVRME